MRRTATAFLWFLSIWCCYELLISIAGGPRPAGPVIGAVAASFVYLDPAQLFWARRREGTSTTGTSRASAPASS